MKLILALVFLAVIAVVSAGVAYAPIGYASHVAVAAPATVLTRTYHGSPLINGLSTGTVLI